SAQTDFDAPEFGSLDVSVNLTPAGLAHYPRVMELFFATVANLRAAGYPSYLFHERQAMARLDETYQDKGEGAERAVTLASLLNEYPLEIAEREPYLWLKEDPAAYQLVLDQLRPDNLLVTLVAKGLPTDKVEPYYDTNY